MIPDFNASMVLPPMVGDDPAVRATMSPFKATLFELVERFATSPERIGILRGVNCIPKSVDRQWRV